jgi:hypothetical protein
MMIRDSNGLVSRLTLLSRLHATSTNALKPKCPFSTQKKQKKKKNCFVFLFDFLTFKSVFVFFFFPKMSGNNSTKGRGKRRRVDKFYQMAKEQGIQAKK